ncbi:MAG TPA: peptidase MA family metallohydrolase [bacterium]|jgi:hypothetical protein
MEQDSARFRILYSTKDAGVVRDLWRVLRERVPVIEQNLGLALGDTVRFIIAPDQMEWGRLTQGTPLWANGVAYSERGIAILKSPSFGQQYGPFPTTATHEYVHLLLHAGAPRAEIPRWLDEGLAQVLSGQFDYVESAALARAAAANRLHSFRQLESMLAMSGLEARQGYAESAVAVQLLQLRYGMSGLSNLVHELRTGQDYDEAFARIFGVSSGSFENQYVAYIKSTYRLSLIGDTELWLSGLFVLLVLAAGTAMWYRRRRTLAKWKDEEMGTHGGPRETWPPYIVNYTIIRSRQGEEEDTSQGKPTEASDQPPGD